MSIATAPAGSSRSTGKIVFFIVLGALTLFVIYMKNARILDPNSEIAQHFAGLLTAFLAEVGQLIAIILIGSQSVSLG